MLINAPQWRILGLMAAAVTLVLAFSAPAWAGTQLCIGGPKAPATSPDENGTCKKTYTLTTLADDDDVDALEAENGALTARVAALETTLSKVSYQAAGLNGLPTLTIDGANLQIVNGSGVTAGTVNGLGNLFIGYAENPFNGDQTGSHNLVLGERQSFTSYGGLIAGFANTLSGGYSGVFGASNKASGFSSSVTGGESNTASGNSSSVSGGFDNTARSLNSSVSGGLDNTASEFSSSVSGGRSNTASSFGSSVSGGARNAASGTESSVSGGELNEASGRRSSILGGSFVTVNTTNGTSP